MCQIYKCIYIIKYYYIEESRCEYAKCWFVVMSSSSLVKSIHAVPQFVAKQFRTILT